MRKYVKAEDILPKELIEEIQKYVEGTQIYIPRTSRDPWGANNGIRKEIDERNKEIRDKFDKGASIIELSRFYNLSEERIRNIIYEKTK